jgi:Domain of unknown function (DUF4258)
MQKSHARWDYRRPNLYNRSLTAPKRVSLVAAVELVLNKHVLDRMALRGVRKADIETVLADPEADWPSEDDPLRRVYAGQVRGRTIRVVVVEGTDPIDVITVWVQP